MTSGNGIEVSGWGATLKAEGKNVILFLCIAALAAILFRGLERLELMEAQRTHEHQAIIESSNELACVLTLDQSARPAALNDPHGICHYVRTMFPLSKSQFR